MSPLTQRLASLDDMHALSDLMDEAIGTHIRPYRSPEQFAASRSIMDICANPAGEGIFMQHRTAELIARDGVRIAYQSWQPDASPIAALCIHHGLGEHGGRYGTYVQHVLARGYAVYAIDMRGHGRSGGKRGHTPSYETLLDDVGDLIAIARSEQGRRPIFLLGHSLGGNIALNFALRRPAGLSAVLASAPWLMLPKPPAKPLAALARGVSKLAPSFTLGNQLDLTGISRDPAVIAGYKADPLVHDRISVKLFVEGAAAAAWALEHASEIAVPALLFHGSADRLTSPAGTRLFAERAGSAKVTHREYAGMYHEMHHDIGKDAVIEDVARWLTAKLGS